MRYLKTNNRNWRKLCKGEVQAEQQKINIEECYKVMSKEFYGEISIVATLSYVIKAENEDEAKEKLFSANCPIELIDDDGNKICEIAEQQWHLVDKKQTGNIAESDLRDFWIEEDMQ